MSEVYISPGKSALPGSPHTEDESSTWNMPIIGISPKNNPKSPAKHPEFHQSQKTDKKKNDTNPTLSSVRTTLPSWSEPTTHPLADRHVRRARSAPQRWDDQDTYQVRGRTLPPIHRQRPSLYRETYFQKLATVPETVSEKEQYYDENIDVDSSEREVVDPAVKFPDEHWPEASTPCCSNEFSTPPLEKMQGKAKKVNVLSMLTGSVKVRSRTEKKNQQLKNVLA